MDNGAGSGHHKGHTMPAPPRDTVITPPGTLKLAISATFHCLIGCGIGEIAGMVIAMWLGMGLMDSMILAIILGFIAGLALGIVPLFKAGFTMAEAFKTVIIAEGLSIAVMEAVEVWTQLSIPGVMEAGLTDGLFWLGMFLGLAAGFVAALPVNYVVIARGVRHQH
jgi:hypothetical protein